jgi:hypothetical protein
MSKHAHCNNLPGPLDRSKCVFPSSSKTSDAAGNKILKADLLDAEKSVPLANVPAVLKAAWVLTLQCFVVADVFCFAYDGPTKVNNGLGEERTQTVTAMYVLRIDRSEPVRSLVTRFGKKERAPVPAEDPENYEINTVDRGSLHHQCNTAISYRVLSEQSNESPTPEPLQQEVS